MRSIETAGLKSERLRRERPIHQPNFERDSTMKRKLIAIAAVGLAIGATAAFADNNYTFDDAYWKQSQSVQAVQSTQSTETKGKYDQVDRYNP
jgi:hypothetical protein